MSTDHGLEPPRAASSTSRAPAGWYPDPEQPDQIRYWTGLTWDDPPLQPRHVPGDSSASETTERDATKRSLRVRLWYLLAVFLPMVLVVVIPGRWAEARLAQGLMPRPFADAAYLAGAPQHVVELRSQTLTIGWALVGAMALGTLVGLVLFNKARGAGDQSAVAANRIAWAAVACTIVIALLLSSMVNVIVFEPYPHGGVIGIGL